MTKSEHLQFLALITPTVLLLVLAAASLADLNIELIFQRPAPSLQAAQAVHDAGHEIAY
jgi:hypothetical protein